MVTVEQMSLPDRSEDCGGQTVAGQRNDLNPNEFDFGERLHRVHS
jgi:hypothetical protein